MITENLSTLKIHKLTQEQYDRELAAGRLDENAIYLTPDTDSSGAASDVSKSYVDLQDARVKGYVDDSVTSITDGLAASASQGLEYLLMENGTYAVTGIGTCTDTRLVIPAFYNGKKVTAINDSAFIENETITSIMIPDTVTHIGEYAFGACPTLTDVTIGKNVSAIGSYAFANCSLLNSVVVPASVNYMGTSVFSGVITPAFTIYCEVHSKPDDWNAGWNKCQCTVVWGHVEEAFTKQYVDSKDAEVRDYINTKIAEVPIPDVTKDYVDEQDEAVKDYIDTVITASGIKIPSEDLGFVRNNDGTCRISDIGTCADTDIVIPAIYHGCKVVAITGMGSNWPNITSVEIPNSVTTIGSCAFDGCTTLTNIIIPNSITNIEAYAFRGCSNLKIYCEAKTQPSGWHTDWNSDNCPVVWGIDRKLTDLPALKFASAGDNSVTVTKDFSVSNAEIENVPSGKCYFISVHIKPTGSNDNDTLCTFPLYVPRVGDVAKRFEHYQAVYAQTSSTSLQNYICVFGNKNKEVAEQWDLSFCLGNVSNISAISSVTYRIH